MVIAGYGEFCLRPMDSYWSLAKYLVGISALARLIDTANKLRIRMLCLIVVRKRMEDSAKKMDKKKLKTLEIWDISSAVDLTG